VCLFCKAFQTSAWSKRSKCASGGWINLNPRFSLDHYKINTISGPHTLSTYSDYQHLHLFIQLQRLWSVTISLKTLTPKRLSLSTYIIFQLLFPESSSPVKKHYYVNFQALEETEPSWSSPPATFEHREQSEQNITFLQQSLLGLGSLAALKAWS
jgi:hypothetical protein